MKKSNKIGDRIKEAREKARNGRGMSQAELAETVGITQASLSEIELGKSAPRKPTLIALAIVIDDYFGEDWLREFFEKTIKNESKPFNHNRLLDVFRRADELNKESVREMTAVWEMLESEIMRRKKLETD